MNRRRFIKGTAASAIGTAAIGTTDNAAGAQKASKSKSGSAKRKVLTNKAPIPGGPLSQAIIAGNTIYVAGQVPTDPTTGKMVSGGIEEQAARVLENIKAILEAAGASMDDVVKVNVYMADLGDFAKMNEVYKRYFKEDYPARATVGVKLLGTMQIEIECTAVKG
ncbi:MAG TPA: Rid family detoxifying hydrolase [Blastocatellia bacterium]|nr:Rid family detoxifying hydrolase [Blastocatellia bacterium]